MVGDYINKMKTTFEFNFDFNKLLTAWIHKNMEVKRIYQLKKILFDYL